MSKTLVQLAFRMLHAKLLAIKLQMAKSKSRAGHMKVNIVECRLDRIDDAIVPRSTNRNKPLSWGIVFQKLVSWNFKPYTVSPATCLSLLEPQSLAWATLAWTEATICKPSR